MNVILGYLMRKKLNQIFGENKKGEILLMSVHVDNETEEQVIWYVDTDCSNHLSGSKSYSTDLN